MHKDAVKPKGARYVDIVPISPYFLENMEDRQWAGMAPTGFLTPVLATRGYPDDSPRVKIRKTTDQICSRNRYE